MESLSDLRTHFHNVLFENVFFNEQNILNEFKCIYKCITKTFVFLFQCNPKTFAFICDPGNSI